MTNPKQYRSITHHQSLTRRSFLRLGGTSTAALLLAGCGVQSLNLSGDPAANVPAQSSESDVFAPDLELALTAQQGLPPFCPARLRRSITMPAKFYREMPMPWRRSTAISARSSA